MKGWLSVHHQDELSPPRQVSCRALVDDFVHDALTRAVTTGQESVLGIVFELDPRHDCITRITPGVETLLGFSPTQITRFEAITNRLIHPADRQRFAEALASLDQAKDTCSVDIRVFDANHATRQLRLHLARRRHGKAIIAAAADIGKLAQALHGFEATAVPAHSILERMLDVYYRTDVNGIIKEISPSVLTMVGYAPEEVLGKDAAQFYAIPSKRNKTLAALREHPEGHLAEVWLRHKEGHRIAVSAHIRLWHHPDGTPGGAEGIFRDITEQRRLHEALKSSEALYRTLFDISPAGIIYTDPQGVVIDCNNAALSVLGATRDFLVGLDLQHELKNSDMIVALKELLRSGKSRFEGYYRSVASQRLSYLELTMQALHNEAGERTGVMIVLFDRLEEKRALDAAAEAAQQSERYLQIAPVIILVLDAFGKVSEINQQGTKLLGCNVDDLLGESWIDLAVPDDERDAVHAMFQALSHNKAAHTERFENHILTPEGARLIAWRNLPLYDAHGAFCGVLSAGEDITEKRVKEARLRMLGAMFERIDEGVMVCNAEGNITDVNPAFERITGYAAREVLDKNPSLLSSGEQDDAFYQQMWHNLRTNRVWQGEIVNRKKSGETYPEWLSITAITDDNGNPTNYIALFSDITRLKRSEAKMRQLALHDVLTGIPNRFYLDERIEQLIHHADRETLSFPLLFLDLDDFKRINDIYGHDVGDMILLETAERIKMHLRGEDTVARFGGDEFVILLESVPDNGATAAITRKLLDVFKEPFTINNQTHYLGASIGIALYPQDAANAKELISRADTAMYRAKHGGKNRYAFYTKAFSDILQKRMQMEDELRHAIERNEFVLHYQPQIDVQHHNISGIEALVRWQKSDGTLVAPSEFIPVMEETRQIIALTQWIFHTAFTQTKAWVEQGVFHGRVAVNISGTHLEQGHLLDDLHSAYTAVDLLPEHIEIEVTETVLMRNAPYWQKVLLQLKAMGLSIAIDDFGTGYSSLSYLANFPLSVLKIDKSFVDGLPRDQTAVSLANTVISLANSMGLSSLAEGVETQQQANWLRENGCHILQGYLYAKPMEAEALTRYLALR